MTILDRDPDMDVCEPLAQKVTDVCRGFQGIDVIITVTGVLTVALIESSPDLEVALRNVDILAARIKNSLRVQMGH
jgi:hypothetical protein